MKEMIIGVISLIGCIVLILFTFYLIVEENNLERDGLLYLLFLIQSVVTILYIIWTKFGQKVPEELKKIDYENEILKKKIEHQELLKRLENSNS